MQTDKELIRTSLRKVCSQHLWMPVPQELEDKIVDAAANQLAPEDIDASPYGVLFELAVEFAHEYHGYGVFASVYDDEISVLPVAHPEIFDDGKLGTYRMINCYDYIP